MNHFLNQYYSLLRDRLLSVAGLAIAVLLATAPVTGFASEKVVLQLKWLHQFQFAGYYAAIKEGYFAAEDLDVELREVVRGETAVDAILQGRADYGIADSSLVLSRLRGDKVVVLATIFQHSPLVLITPASSGIVNPLELRGKRVMFRRNIDDAVLQAMFVEVGLKEGDYTHIPQTFREDALMNDADAISAYTTNQPYYFQQHNIPINIISPANYGIDFYGDMLFTSEAYLTKNPRQVLSFRRAALKGWDYAVKHPEEVIDWMLENLPGINKTKAHLLFEAERTIRLIKPELIEIGYFSDNRFLRIADIYQQLGLAPPASELAGIGYTDHLNTPTINSKWFRISLVAACLLLLTFIVLAWVNKRLRQKIIESTREIHDANTELEKRQMLLDQHVLICTSDLNGVITGISAAYSKLTGYSQEEIIGQPALSLLHADFPQSSLDDTRDILLQNNLWSGEFQHRSRLADCIWVHAIVETQHDSHGNPTGALTIFEDITDKKKILALSTTDSLTGLANRRKIEECLEMYIKQASRYGRNFSLVVLDIDHFKSINDTLGHNRGDEVLIAIAQLVMNTIREADIAGRWGGEEFVVICPETDLQGARQLAELLRKRVTNAQLLEERSVTSSFGVAQWQPSISAKELFNRADQALYEAKGQGRDRVIAFE